MSSSFFVYCCDPLRCHARRRTYNRNLRCVSKFLIDKFPSLKLTTKHKLCPSCRIKLYKLPGEAVSSGSSEHYSGHDVTTTSTGEANMLPIVVSASESASVFDIPGPATVEIATEAVAEITAEEYDSISTVTAEESSMQSESESEYISGQDAISDIIAQLKEKFKCLVNRSEKVKLLTILPKSWSVRKIMKEFGAPDYMVRQAKKLVHEKGIFTSPNPKLGKGLAPTTEQLIAEMYLSDEMSRVMPGMKDYVSIMTDTGKREHVQKRLILCSLKELYEHFKTLHPNVKVGFSTFASRRPKHCVLAGGSGTHSVCVCTLHQNTKLMFIGSKLPIFSQQSICHYRHCLAAIMCNPPSIDCYMSQCKQCPGTEKLQEKLLAIMDDNVVDSIQYQQWTQTDRSSLKTVVQPVEEFLDEFMAVLKKLQYHDFIAKVQSNFILDIKSNLRSNEYLVIADFSENYTCVVQDAVQSYHWHATSVTVHPFLCYYQDPGGSLQHKCYVIISEHTEHDTVAVHLFQRKLIQFLTETFTNVPNKIVYFSDGCSAQYKNRKNFINLCHHLEDFNVPAEWHFFATSHGKTAADGVAGTLKRLATKASLQHPDGNQILNAKQLFDFAVREIKGISFCYVTSNEHREEADLLRDRFDRSITIPGTQKFHNFKPIDTSTIEVKNYSTSSKAYKKRVSKL